MHGYNLNSTVRGNISKKKADRDYSTETTGRARHLMLKVHMYCSCDIYSC